MPVKLNIFTIQFTNLCIQFDNTLQLIGFTLMITTTTTANVYCVTIVIAFVTVITMYIYVSTRTRAFFVVVKFVKVVVLIVR